LLILYVGYQYIPLIQSIPSIGQIIQPIGYLCFGGLYYLWKKDGLNKRPALFVFFIAFPLAWIKLITGGLLTPLVLFVLFYLLMRFWISKTLPVAPMIIAPILILLIYPLLPQIRGLIWAPHWNENYIHVMKTYIYDITHKDKYGTLGAPVSDRINLRYRGLAQRIAHMSVFTYVVDHTPDPKPFLNGESYRPLLTSMVPRVFWPGKPEERFGNDFGRRYGFLSPTDKSNSINVPWITEMYVNFRTKGVFGGMFLLGIALSALVRFLAHSSSPPLEQITGAAILFPLFYQDSNLSLMVGSLPWQIVGIWAFFFVAFKLPLSGFKNN
jgi:hypothetical protein